MRGGKDDHNIKPGPVTLASINDKTEKEIRNERVKSRGRRTEEILYITWVVMSSPRRHQMVYQNIILGNGICSRSVCCVNIVAFSFVRNSI